MEGSAPAPNRRTPWLYVAIGVLVAALVAVGLVLALGGDEAKGQTVTFQRPTDRGPDPFTRPADVHGRHTVKLGAGPFGGTGSDLVCNRELLIRSLRARPDRLRVWAEVLDVRPTVRAVSRYIRRLHPATLTVDTRVTNHSFVGGRAVAFQSILAAGTAVLVDDDGHPVARCRCGNPLLEAIYVPQATCYGCPQDYDPPPACRRDCYRRYPDPPPVCCTRPASTPTTTTPPPAHIPQRSTGVPTAAFSPRVGGPTDTYTISFANFPPNEEVNIHLTRPDGVQEDYTARTDASGRGSFTFPPRGSPVPGTYDADVTAGPVIASAQTTVRGGSSGGGSSGGGSSGGGSSGGGSSSGGLQCHPPRSQLEFEQCVDAGQNPG